MPKNNTKKDTKNVFDIGSFIIDLLDRFGFPGTIFVISIIILLSFPSEDQKHQIVNYYLLGKWTTDLKTTVAAISIVICAFLGQNRIYYYKYIKTIRIKDEEILRVSKEKTDLQEKLAGRNLHSSNKEK